MRELKKGYYQHYKGQHYEVLGVGQHSETREDMVIYRALYGDFGLWVRPLEMFSGTVLQKGKEISRFRYITEASFR